MWRFDFKTETWTCLRNSVVGTSTPLPSPRKDAAFWIVGRDLWMFGGELHGDYMSDIWRYNIDDDAWHYVSGPKRANDAGLYDNTIEGKVDYFLVGCD